MHILATARLTLRQITTADAAFILALLNEPSFLQNIGDKGVRTIADARDYIINGPVASYEKFGFGLYLVEHREARAAIGLCGLLKRETLDDVDIGFAFLPQYWGQGLAMEAAIAVRDYAQAVLGLKRIVAITVPNNLNSIRLLEKLGLKFVRMVRLSEDGEELKLFSLPE